MNEMTLKIVFTIVTMLAVMGLSGCAKHIEEPWVPDPGYLQSERNRSADLNQALEHRIRYQNDR
ncbi:MAG: hypothetical protein PVJ39_11085 [Gammaproteobacteria bacterium]|jgi:hypothetical protein